MTKITLTNLGNLQNETTAVTSINNNNAIITAAFDNTISRDGTSPNQMNAAFDMNSFRIVNLPAPITPTEPLRLSDLTSFIGGGGTVISLPAGGITGSILTKHSATDYDVNWGTSLTLTKTVPTGTISATPFSVNLLDIINQGQQTVEATLDTFNLFGVTTGFRVNYQSAGAGLGQFPIQIGGLFATKATSIGQQLVGLNGTTYTNLDSTGTDSYWGVIGYTSAGPLSNFNAIYGVDAEVAVSAGAVVNTRVGVAASSLAPVQGSVIDAGFMVTAAIDKDATTAPWHNALVLWKTGATAPIDQSVITASGSFTAQYCIKLDTVTFANKIFDFGASIFQMDGVGNTTIGGTTTFIGTPIINKSVNSPAIFSISNTSTGTGATASVSISNSLDQSSFGLAGSGYTTVTQLANRAYIHSGPANNGIILDAAGAKPIDFYVNGSRAGGFTTAGLLTLTTPLAVAQGGTGIVAFGTGIATALGINVGTAGAPVVFNGAGGTPSSITLTNGTGLPATGLTGTLQAAQEPAHTGDMTNTAGSLATTVLKTNGVSFTSYATAAVGQLAGTTTNDNASAGNIGEYVSSTLVRASATALTTATPKTVTSISLTAGDWDVDVVGGFIPANTTQVTQAVVSISTTTNTLDTTEGKLGVVTTPATTYDGATQAQVSLPPYRLSLASTTTIFLVAQSTFTVSTNAAFGIIRARRVR